MADPGKKKSFMRRLFLQDLDNDQDDYPEYPHAPQPPYPPEPHGQYPPAPGYPPWPQGQFHPQGGFPVQQPEPQYPTIPAPPYQPLSQPPAPPPQQPHGAYNQYPQQPGIAPQRPPAPQPMPYTPAVAPPPPEKWVELTLHLETGPISKKLTAFPFTIGRESLPSGLTIEDKSVSSRHAVMDLLDDQLTITDTNSRNGVKLNETVITPGITTPLNIGDTITVGRTKITVDDYSEENIKDEAPAHGGTEFISQHTVMINAEESPLAYQNEEPRYPAQMAQPPAPAPIVPPPAPMQSPVRICSKCGYSNTDKDKFCGECGAPTAPPAPVSPPPQAAPKKFCIKCGTKNESLGRFCLTCGNSLG